ncbi:MAG: gliding motility-associated C-terminal domain-containing protein [Flavobacteriales bacterium]|nr:gliding motility-associated C-terminal domain-containing protein [Flavobacteriales bacterium]
MDNNTQWNASGWQNGDDGSNGPIAIPFQFNLYGTSYNVVYININGNLSFGNGNYYGSFSANGFPVNGFAMVAPFWADVDLRGTGCTNCNIVQYKVTPTAMYVNWTRVGYYSMQTNMLNTFQVVITDGIDPVVPNGANVSFCYKDMQWTTGAASGGVGGFGGTPANVGANKGDGVNYMQFGRFDHAGNDYDGPFGGNDGVSWLDDKHLMFTTNQTSANVPPVITSASVCDSLVLCVGEQATLEVEFLSPEPNQVTSSTSSAPTLSNWNVVSSTSGLVSTITVQFTPLPTDVGYHLVTFSGTDNGSPVLTSTLSVVVHVIQGGNIAPGSLTVCDNGASVNLLADVLGPTAPAGGTWTSPSGQPHSGTFTPSTDAPGDYLYAVLAGNNCATLGTVAVAEVPHAWAGNNAVGVYCTDGLPVDLFSMINGAPQATGAWLSPVGQSFTGLLDPATDGSGNYLYIVSGSSPCPNDTSAVAITVNQAVDAGVPNALTLCVDASPLDMLASLQGTPTPGGTWTTPSNAPWSGTFVAATDAVGVYTYTVTTALPCLNHSSTLTLAVDPAPWAGSDAALTRCANDGSSALFPLLGGNPNLNGSWQDPALVAHTGTLNPPTALSGAHLYIVPGLGACTHLIDTAEVAVTINPLPRVAFSADPDSGCHALEVSLYNDTPPEDVGATCIWQLGDGTITAECDTLAHTFQNPGSYSVQLSVTSPDGCTHVRTQYNFVLVEKAPEAAFLISPNPGHVGNSTIFFTALDEDNVHYTWTLDGQHHSVGNRAQQWFSDALGSDHEICLAVADRYACTDTVCLPFSIVVPAIFHPNAFTPDNDGLNDKFYPRVLDVVREEHVFQVFNRWGELIFRSTEPSEGWDGTAGGQQVPQGVYVWRLEGLPMYSADKVELFGTVTLIR